MNHRIESTSLPDLLVVEVLRHNDGRGFFMEIWNRRDFAALGIAEDFVQDNHSRSVHNVLRGLHFQDMTAPLAKLVRCTVGAIWDVAVDLRVGSPTFGQWFGIELSADNHKQLFVPVGFAHGFAVLSDIAEVQYKQTGYYVPRAETTLLWNDPQIGIAWPVVEPVLSARDGRGIRLQEYLRRPAFFYSARS